MAFRCPVCDRDVKTGDTKCPGCGEPLHAASFVGRLWRSLWAGFTRVTSVECPACGEPAAAKSKYCMRCTCNFTVAAALVPILRPLRNKWDAVFKDASPASKRFARIAYVIASAVLFWLVLSYSEKKGAVWYLYAALSIVYVAFFTFFLLWVVPREHLSRFVRQRKGVVRIGLIFNFFTALLLLQVLMATWTARALMLGALFIVSWLGFYFFLVYIFPVWCGMSVFFDDYVPFDHTARQGRTARRD